MVCIRCKMIVKAEIEALGLQCVSVNLGEAIIMDPVLTSQLDALNHELKKTGLELLESGKSRLVEKIKSVIIEMIHYRDEDILVNFSDYLAAKMDYDYTYLSNLFAHVQGTTLEQFVIAHKIEKVKELLVYDKLSLTEVADKMQYSSVQHLSNQFKKVTGFTPTAFKKLGANRFKDRDQL